MKHVKVINIKRMSNVSAFSRTNCTEARKLYNSANYMIRNLRSAMYKASTNKQLSQKEEELLLRFRINLLTLQENDGIRFKKIIASALKKGGLKAHAIIHKNAYKESITEITYGNMAFIYSYEFLDKYMKDTNNIHYRTLPAQVNQQVLRKLARDWKAYFNACRSYKKDPSKFTGKPKAPKYKNEFCTITFTSQISKISYADNKAWISIAGCKDKICIGSSDLYKNMKYIQTEITYKHNHFELHITSEDKIEEISIPEHPERILGVDLGVDNFMSCFSNVEEMPSLLFKGKYLKSVNVWFNKRRQQIISNKTKGHKTTKNSTQSKQINNISNKRDNIFRDYFYKTSHYLCRICKTYDIEAIVIGENKNWKQNTNIGKINNQNFVCMPYDKFRQILKYVAIQYNIPVIMREESYTSQASLADKDMIPDYEHDNKISYIFSGKRSKKTYMLNDGIIVHADINGAGNIARKEYPYMIDNLNRNQIITKMQNIKTIDINDIYANIKRISKQKHIKDISISRKEHRNSRWIRKLEYRYLFNAKRKTVKGVKGMCLPCKAVS